MACLGLLSFTLQKERRKKRLQVNREIFTTHTSVKQFWTINRGGLNWYNFVTNNPVNKLDLLGLIIFLPPPETDDTLDSLQNLGQDLMLHWVIGGGSTYTKGGDILKTESHVKNVVSNSLESFALDKCEDLSQNETDSGSYVDTIDNVQASDSWWTLHTLNMPDPHFVVDTSYTAETDSDCCCDVEFNGRFVWLDKGNMEEHWPDSWLDPIEDPSALPGTAYPIYIEWEENMEGGYPLNASAPTCCGFFRQSDCMATEPSQRPARPSDETTDLVNETYDG